MSEIAKTPASVPGDPDPDPAATEIRFQTLFNSAAEFIFVIDRDGKILQTNHSVLNNSGYSEQEMVGHQIKEFFTEASQTICECNFPRLRESGSNRADIDFVRKDGRVLKMECSATAIPESSGRFETFLIIQRDVTERVKTENALRTAREELEQRVAERTRHLHREIEERRRAEEALRNSEERLRALINATTDDVVVLLDENYRIEISNTRAAEGFGTTVDHIVGKRMEDLMPAEVAARRKRGAEAVIRTGNPARFEDERAGRWYDNNMSPVFGPDKRPCAVAIFARDITGRKSMERALSKAKETAEAANAAKSRFLAAANHDLRQPMQAINLFLEVLRRRHTEPGTADVLNGMTEALRSMEGMLNSMLDISKLDAGIITPVLQDFAARPFLERLAQQFEAIARAHAKTIRVHCTDVSLHCDPALLDRIIQNFLSNAIQHATGERVLLCCRGGGRSRRIEVWDQGEGIPEHQLHRVFEDFYQLGNPARDRSKGLGLGLAIAKRMADLLDLKLAARSLPGRGSVFSVQIPVGERPLQPQPTAGAAGPHRDASGQRILVVDDDAMVLDATRALLEAWGFTPMCADCATDALALVQPGREEPVIALLDYRLADGRTGTGVLQQLEQRLGRRVPAILLTGDISSKQLLEVQESGLPVLHKPIETSTLRRFLRTLLEENATLAPRTPKADTPDTLARR
jgi:PAS domain S-box-containing protein